MRVKDLPLKTLPLGVLLERLDIEGWGTNHSGLAQEFIRRWALKLNCAVEDCEAGENHLFFTIRLGDLRLRTMHEVPCAMLGGGDDVSDALNGFWRKHSTPTYLPFFLTLSAATYEQAQEILPNGQCVILSAAQIKQVLSVADAKGQLKIVIRQQIPRRRLIPYNFLLPAEGGMFFGRDEECNNLLEKEEVNFAIAGPGRIGKTSLIKRYRAKLLRDRSPRTSRLSYISFYRSDPSPDEAARFLAMSIRPTSMSNRVTTNRLVDFMHHASKTQGGPLELLLDEVDEVCQGETFNALGEAAKHGYCRLILCGRGGLLKMMLGDSSPLASRLDLLQLGPLQHGPACALLLEPLNDLGFHIPNADVIMEEVLGMTGRLPHFLQLFGVKLAELAIQRNTEVITLELLNELKGDFLISQFFVKSLASLDDHEARLVGLALVEDSPREITLSTIQQVAQREGLRFVAERALEICTELVVNNVLVWERDCYHLANEGLPFYARRTGYLHSALADARGLVGSTT